MWSVEIIYKYTNSISVMLFDTEDEAKIQRDKLIGLMGKDSYDLKKNGGLDAVSLVDKFGTMHTVPSDVKGVRMYNRNEWDRTIIQERIRQKSLQKSLQKELGDDPEELKG